MGDAGRTRKWGKGRCAEEFAPVLLAWYDRQARALPWRMPPGGGRPDPYHVLVSEVMLQQTTAQVVGSRFPQFLAQFPDLATLAEADDGDVMAAWAGLGYYRRARSLHACARVLVSDHGGTFPSTEEELRSLPGIGDYTAAAISAIAFDRPAVVVDGNIERVVARVFGIETPLPAGKKAIRKAASELSPQGRPGDFAQAMMDLGALVCRPRSPDCLLCPVRTFCRAAGTPLAESLPNKAPKRAKKEVYGTMVVLLDRRGRVLCEKRPPSGLFAGMLGLPGGGWDGRDVPEVAVKLRPAGSVTHILTHRRLEIEVLVGSCDGRDGDGQWLPAEEAAAAMPTLFRKALERGLSWAGA